MNILFWNLGKEQTKTKLDLLRNCITEHSPNIVCIAEFSYSIDDCKTLHKLFQGLGYECYYSPLFSITDTTLAYPFKRNGLKVYFKPPMSLSDKFSDGHQRYEGRIIRMPVKLGTKSYILYFIHNESKSGTKVPTIAQTIFISKLSDIVLTSPDLNITGEVIILGDFNLEPWDHIMREQKILDTYFVTKYYHQNKRLHKNRTSYYTPITEYIIATTNQNLCGTYFSKKSGWALFDYVLSDNDNINFDIITNIGDTHLLDSNTNLKNFMHEELDHLPIIIKTK